jgi:RNA polymerase sigma factor (sigma-70 family)
MNSRALIPHLFRTEYSKIIAVLCKHFGFEHLNEAEDITSDTFLSAMQSWPYEGVPENPTAWLYTVAKHKALNHITRKKTFQNKIAPDFKNDQTFTEEPIDLSTQNINDSQLRMIFAICHPSLPKESQVALALRILCGFGIDEIANAFLTGKDTINKRLFRAKEKLRSEKVVLAFPESPQLDHRLDSVLMTLYLLFNEGYYSESGQHAIREELCFEAMRLAHLLVNAERTNLPVTNALLALMCFHASRLKARKGKTGEMILYEDQNENEWDQELISTGAHYLHAASQGVTLSKYHLEASIACWHTRKEDTKEKWQQILSLYNHLLTLSYSPIVALNRTFALAKVYGPEQAINEAKKLQLTSNHFYFTLLGELYRSIDSDQAKENFERAYKLAKTRTDQETLQRKITALVSSDRR